MDRTFHVYILAGESGVLYTGMTNNLMRRIVEHKRRKIPGFTAKYNVTKLVWFEAHGRASSAIARETQIKGWSRAKKVALIEAMNPHWKGLTEKLQTDSPPVEFGSK
jgi:putative endonuclease